MLVFINVQPSVPKGVPSCRLGKTLGPCSWPWGGWFLFVLMALKLDEQGGCHKRPYVISNTPSTTFYRMMTRLFGSGSHLKQIPVNIAF